MYSTHSLSSDSKFERLSLNTVVRLTLFHARTSGTKVYESLSYSFQNFIPKPLLSLHSVNVAACRYEKHFQMYWFYFTTKGKGINWTMRRMIGIQNGSIPSFVCMKVDWCRCGLSKISWVTFPLPACSYLLGSVSSVDLESGFVLNPFICKLS
jgi:hypothetical protein